MTAQVPGEDPLAMADGVLRAHALETGPLPGLRLHFDQEGAHARAVAVVVRAEGAVPGLAKGQGEAVENPGSPVPDEFVEAPVAARAEALRILFAHEGVGAVGADDQVRASQPLRSASDSMVLPNSMRTPSSSTWL